jgi:hypothetical protein
MIIKPSKNWMNLFPAMMQNFAAKSNILFHQIHCNLLLASLNFHPEALLLAILLTVCITGSYGSGDKTVSASSFFPLTKKTVHFLGNIIFPFSCRRLYFQMFYFNNNLNFSFKTAIESPCDPFFMKKQCYVESNLQKRSKPNSKHNCLELYKLLQFFPLHLTKDCHDCYFPFPCPYF